MIQVLGKLLFASIILSVCQSAKLPSDIQICKFGDAKCIAESAGYVAKNYKDGSPSMGLLSIDPIQIPEVSILEDKNSKKQKAVNINLWFKDWNMYGFSKMKVKKIQGFEKNFPGKLIFDAYIPQIVLVGQYKINGQVLVLPIQGAGFSNLTLDNCKLHVEAYGKEFEKKEKRHIQLDGISRIDMKISKLRIRLDNLFNGNKQLSDTMNQFLNDNWKEIYDELKPGVLDALGQVVVNLVNNVFAKLPYDDLLQDDTSLELQKCKITDNECILNTINNQVLKNSANGISALNLSPLEPLRVETLSIEQGGSSPVNIKLYFKNLAYSGFSRAKMVKLNGLKENINDSKLNFDLHVPLVSQVGQYKITGSVLILPISGNGLSNMTFVESVMKFRSTTKSVMKGGEEYLQIDRAKLKIDTSRLYLNFDHLFNGNQDLSNNMNRFLNNNWKTIYSELRGAIQTSFVGVVKNVVNDVFAQTPYKNLFVQ
uniref:CSON008368 protein n=1 Tax=Culicoides sonorensis TaxID=179676 RepID=A0A336LYW3_CULSO